MYYIKHLQIFALNWHITQYACECIYIYTLTPVLFSIWHLSTKQHVYFKLLFAPWSVQLFKTTRLASVSWINSLSSLTTCSRVAGTGFCWFGALGVGNGNPNQTWLIFENRNAGMNWDTSMMTDVFMELNGVIVAIHLWRDDLKQLRCHNVPQFYSLTHLKVLENWKNLDHCTSRSRLLTPNRAHLSNSWQHLTYESHSMIGIL